MPRRRRSNRVAEDLAVAVAFLAGGAAALAPPAPTGRPLVDALLVGTGIGVVTWAGASAPWWATVLAAGAAVAVAGDLIVAAVALVALAAGIWIGLRRRNMPAWRAVSVGLSMNALAWGAVGGSLGLTAIVGVATALVVCVAGVRRRPRRIRRRAWLACGVVATAAVVATLGFGLAASSSRSDLARGQRLAEDGIDLLDDGDFAGAAERFEEAATALASANDRLNAPWAAPAGLVPVVAQHRAAAERLSAGGAVAAAEVAAALHEIDPDRLELERGAIDLAAVEALEDPFARVHAALDRLSRDVAASQSPWLIDAVRDELDSLDERLTDNAPRLENARIAIDLAPSMLGRDEPRRYLVLFTTPAEARGLGGFPGNYLELTMDGGRIEMTDFGRTSTLEERGREAGVVLDGPEPLLARYGRFIAPDDGQVGEAPLRNLTMAPHFPWVAEAAAELYSDVTGRDVHGVIAMDPFVVARLLRYTGEVPLTTMRYDLDASNAVDFLLREQYELASSQGERIDALEEAAERTFRAMLAGSIPDPAVLARDLGPLVAERRLMVWTRDPAEQTLLRRARMLGELPHHGGAPAWGFTVTNAGGNKIDSFLERRAAYDVRTDEATGETTATLRVELTNTAPATGLPDYVIGNAVGLPPGTNRMLFTAYSSLPLTAATLDGHPLPVSPDVEASWNVYARFIEIPPGDTVRLQFDFAGRVDRLDEVVTWTQPLVLPLEPLG